MGDAELIRQARRVGLEVSVLARLAVTKAARVVLSRFDSSRDWLYVPIDDLVHVVPGFVGDPGDYGEGRWIVPGDRVAHDVGPGGCWCVPVVDNGVVVHHAVSLQFR